MCRIRWTPCIFNIHFNIILLYMRIFSNMSVTFWYTGRNFVRISDSSHVFYMSSLSHPRWLDHFNNVWRSLQVCLMVCLVKRSYKMVNAMVNMKLFDLGNTDYQLPPRMYQIKPLFPITVSLGSSGIIVTTLQDGWPSSLSRFPGRDESLSSFHSFRQLLEPIEPPIQ
jgi:hypothetical protein